MLVGVDGQVLFESDKERRYLGHSLLQEPYKNTVLGAL